MTGSVRRTPLSSIPFFAEMQPEQRQQIEVAGGRRLVKRGRCFFREGGPSTGLHVLLSGQLKAVRELPGGGEVLRHFVWPGDVFGEIPALLAKPYSANAIAVDDSEVFTLPLTAFKRLIAREPEAGLLFMAALAKKLSGLLERIEVQTSPRAEQRIARSILSKQAGAGTGRKAGTGGGSKGAEICILGTSKKLWAEELGLQPESLSRGLRRLTECGIVKVDGKEIHLCNPVRLAEVAAGAILEGISAKP